MFSITNLANKTQTFVSAQTRAIAYSYCYLAYSFQRFDIQSVFINSLFFPFPIWVSKFNSALFFRVCYSVNSAIQFRVSKEVQFVLKTQNGKIGSVNVLKFSVAFLVRFRYLFQSVSQSSVPQYGSACFLFHSAF